LPFPLAPFCFDRTWAFDAPPDELWGVLTRTDDFRRWWPWLRDFSGDGLVPGGRSACVVRAPIPYTLRFSVTVRDLVPGRLVDAIVDGDLAGPARLEVGPGSEVSGRGRQVKPPSGSQVRLAWEMELERPVLRAVARVGRPVMEWGHDWVVANGVEQFLHRALRVQVHHDDLPDHDAGPGAT